MRILITGATGFVGAHLIRFLRRRDPTSQIVGICRRTPCPDDFSLREAVRLVACDIAQEDGLSIAELIHEIVPDRVYHLAAASSGAAMDRDSVFRANVDGTRHVVEAINRFAPTCRLLFAGTGYVYGTSQDDRPSRETDELPPFESLPIYAQSKTLAERLVRSQGRAIIARAFNHTGPGQTTTFAVPSFAAQIAKIERGEMDKVQVGNLDAIRDFLDVRDVVRAYYELAETGAPGEVYNVCSGMARTMSNVLNSLIELAKQPITIENDPKRSRPAEIPRSVGDPSRLKSAVLWEPEYPFERTLADTLAFYRNS